MGYSSRIQPVVLAFAAALAVAFPTWLSQGPSGAKSVGETPQNGILPVRSQARHDDSRAEKTIRYDRDIRPILSDRCFKCHGPDAAKRQADLRLDQPAPSQGKDDDPAVIVPGSPDESELFSRIGSSDDDDRMPPPGSNKRPLSVEERELVRAWIEQGANYEPHWSFVPPVRSDVPAVGVPQWCRNEIDRFILSRLESEGVEPSPAADSETLIRRLFLDLTGLPPTPEESAAFVGDRADGAYERWVERLLTEEPYRSRHAEHMAARWLDVSRYADTNGIHMDAGRQMWLWRDWVLNAFRTNMPFDRFTIEQLAGDLLPEATTDQRIASGFNRNHVVTDEGGAIPEEYLVEYAVDRTATTGAVFMGLTLGCARCHEHKFDPITQDEFYGLYAFFNSLEEPGLYSQLPDPNRAFEPYIPVPSKEQAVELARIDEQITPIKAASNEFAAAEVEQFEAFLADAERTVGWEAVGSKIVSAKSENGATLTITPEQTVVASGENPASDVHTVTLRTDASDLNLICLEALPHSSIADNRVGRAPNGNAVLTSITATATSVADRSVSVPVQFRWAWANVEQANGDFAVVNVLDSDSKSGWAVDSHNQPGRRIALLLSDAPFGWTGGTEIVVRLQYDSVYPQHVFGNVRVRVGRGNDSLASQLRPATSGWYRVGPFGFESGVSPYDVALGPETAVAIDLSQEFGADKRTWRHDLDLKDDTLNQLTPGTNVTFVARRIWSPTARTVKLSLGSDDGFKLSINGQSIREQKVERSLAANQDSVEIPLVAGSNFLLLRIVNTGGDAGFYYRAEPIEDEWPRDLALALTPGDARVAEDTDRLREAWRIRFSPEYRRRQSELAALEKQRSEILAKTPLTMVMKELAEPRPTYVLTRGAYDKPDMNRAVQRSIPVALGHWPAEEPRNRLGLAHWLTSPDNPLAARVAVNRLWEQFFGAGIVQTSEDFGMQGEWPSHPELLDWLAVEFRENHWDVDHMIRLIVTSETYRQSSRVRVDVRERDPQNRWLSYYPRRRLTAEQIRDQALYLSGLLVEKLGGPSVKPYQPEGLWQEVAMLQSNTRIYEPGMGQDLWRRSLYTYWKRACPPPSLQSFDAPTRESCTIRRSSTNTPLQALVLWNDPQFVEAARVLAQRTLTEVAGDPQRLVRMFRRCTGRDPEPDELQQLNTSLSAFRGQYVNSPDDARRLSTVGSAPVAQDIPPAELAAWTMMASALLNLNETIVVD